MREITMSQPTPSLYERLVEAGCETDHHETDLYVRMTDQADLIITQFEAAGGIVSKSTFFSADDGSAWYDLPFAFDPAWKAKG